MFCSTRNSASSITSLCSLRRNGTLLGTFDTIRTTPRREGRKDVSVPEPTGVMFQLLLCVPCLALPCHLPSRRTFASTTAAQEASAARTRLPNNALCFPEPEIERFVLRFQNRHGEGQMCNGMRKFARALLPAGKTWYP
jgi:hypothetical protein